MHAALLGSLIAILIMGVPVFVVLLLPVMVILETTTATSPMLVIQRLFAGIDKFPLMAIPFFIFAGNIMAKGGISKRLIRLANALVRPILGGLGITTVASSMFFSAISGSSPATVIAVGKIMLPAMEKEGYKRSFCIGLLMSSGSMGIIIPPSIFMIVYGAVTGVSIGALFLAGVGAGVVYALAFIGVCVAYARFTGMAREARWDLREIITAVRACFWGLATPFIILGGIYGGVFTPTEAAAVAVVYAIIVSALIYREMNVSDILESAVDSAITTAQVMIIVAAASAFAWYLTTSGMASGLTEMLAGIGSNPVYVLLVINCIILLAGMVLDPNSIIIILVPFIAPVAVAAGIDPIHLGIVLAVNAAIGMFTPPFGLNLFVSAALGVTFNEAVRGALPFIIVGLIALVVITYVPVTSLWLPAQFYPNISTSF